MRDDRWLLAAAVGVLLLAGWLAVPADSGRPLDPRSTGPVGLAAGVAVLEELGADVTIDHTVAEAGATVLLTRLDPTPEQLEDLRDHVEAGGRAVVFDPSLPLAGTAVVDQLVTTEFGPTTATADCDLLEGYVDEVQSSQWLVLSPDVDGQACLSVGAGVGLVVQTVGRGTVAVLGAAQVVTNDHVDELDHARLLALLALPDGPGSVVVLDDRPPGAEGPVATSVLDLVPTRVRAAAALVLAGLVLLGLARARRLAAPVAESLPVRVPGSELVLSIGDLLQRHGHRDAAAGRLRQDVRRSLTRGLDLPADTEPTVVADALRRRAPDTDDGDLRLVLEDTPVADDAALTRIAAAAARLRRAVHDPLTPTRQDRP